VIVDLLSQLEGLALARAWGFESPLPHQSSNAKKEAAYGRACRLTQTQKLVSFQRSGATLVQRLPHSVASAPCPYQKFGTSCGDWLYRSLVTTCSSMRPSVNGLGLSSAKTGSDKKSHEI